MSCNVIHFPHSKTYLTSLLINNCLRNFHNSHPLKLRWAAASCVGRDCKLIANVFSRTEDMLFTMTTIKFSEGACEQRTSQ